MTAYYNEIDPFAAAWLRELIKAGHIAHGYVDERSIEDVTPADLEGFTQCHFFAGIGVWSLALRQAGWPDDRPVWTGSCPCFTAGTLILTEKGHIPIEGIKEGDRVVTHKGELQEVVRTGNDHKNTIILKGQGQSEGIRTTRNHPFYTRTTGRGTSRKSPLYGKKVFLSEPHWKHAWDMKGRVWGTLLKFPHVKPPTFCGTSKGYFWDSYAGRFRVKGEKKGKHVYLGVYLREQDAKEARMKAIVKKQIDVKGADGFDPLSLGGARFLGYWLGDGWTSGDSVLLCGHPEHGELLEDITSTAGFTSLPYLERTALRWRVGSKALVNWLDSNFSKGARNKELPTWVYSMPQEWREAFLGGYMEADGHTEIQKKGGGKVRKIATVSKKLAVGTRALMCSLGRSASLRWCPNDCTVIEGREVNTAGGSYVVTEYERARSYKQDGTYGWGVVRSVEKTGLRERVYNIEVKNDHSYIADGIIVHNCQPFAAPGKGKGFDDERHLWPAFHHLIKECRPPIIFGEQVARKAGLTWVQLVQLDLEGEDYTCGFVVFPACGLGAPHQRQRLYWMANCQRTGLERHDRDGNGGDESGRIEENQIGSTAPGGVSGILDEPDLSIEERVRIRGDSGERDESDACRRDAEPSCSGTSGDVGDGERPGPTNGFWRDADWLFCRDGKWRAAKPGSFVLASRSPNRMGRLRGIGNCIVAPQAKAFIESVIAGMSGDV